MTMKQYTYNPLGEDARRVVRLLPGKPEQDIRIVIDSIHLDPSLISPDLPHSKRSNIAKELEPSLPPGWWVYETNNDEIYYYSDTANDGSWKAFWTHPDPSVESRINQSRSTSQSATAGTTPSTQIPYYQALSYTWQSDHPEEDPIIQETAEQTDSTATTTPQPCSLLRVGGNLACALRHLRQPHETRTLWIDAICINQSDMQEREDQVAKMASIYKAAAQVVVWLGTASADSDLALDKLDYLGSQIVLTKDQWMFCPPDAEEPFWCEGACRVPYSDEVWRAIGSLVARTWFTRIWIIQEVQLAAAGTVIQCGWREVQWSRFRNAITCLWNKKDVSEHLQRTNLASIEFLGSTSYTKASVRHVLRLTKGRHCSDPHDYVYGVLGLLPPAVQELVRPNYRQTPAETYSDLVVAYLDQQGGDLALLRDCRLKPVVVDEGGGSSGLRLPSWVPDFSQTTRWLNPLEWQNAAAKCRAQYRVLGNGLLQVTGIHCGAVDHVEEIQPLRDDEYTYGLFRTFRGSASGDRDPASSSSSSPSSSQQSTPPSPTDSLCRTLCAGRLAERFPDDLPTLEAWRKDLERPMYLSNLLKLSSASGGRQGEARFHERQASEMLHNRVLFKTTSESSDGLIGLGPPETRKGQ